MVCVPSIAYHYAADNWTIGSIACKLSQYLTYVTTYVTVYTLVAVAIVRVCKVTRSSARSHDEHRHSTISATAGGCCHRNIRQVSLLVAALWIVALTANLPVIFAYSIKTFVSSTSLNASDIEPYKYCGGPVASTSTAAYNTYKYCGIEDPEKQGWRIVITFFVLAYVAPLTVIASMSFMLLHHLRRHVRHASISLGNTRPTIPRRPDVAATSQTVATARTSTVVSRRASHVTRVLVVVVVVFAACWLPLHIHLLVAYCGVQPAQRWYEIYRVLAHCLAYANSCMNPVIYSYVSSDFRRRFSDVTLASQSCQCRWSTADNGLNQPQLPMMRMRTASYEAIALEHRSNTSEHCVDLHQTVHVL